MEPQVNTLGGGPLTATPGRLLSLLASEIVSLLTRAIPVINRRCDPYQKGVNTQDKGINKNFENLVGDAARSVLTKMGQEYTSCIAETLSDVSLETDDFILQVDAKGCHVKDGDFLVKPRDKCLHGHCGIAQTSLVSTAPFTERKTGEKTEQKGLQKPEIEGKPVYTFVVFMRWGYTTQYVVESCGVVYLPHTAEDFEFRVGKSHDEMRWVVKNPNLYRIHRFASESAGQTQGSAQSECSEAPSSAPQSQSSPSLQTDPAQPPAEDRTPAESE